VGRRSPDLLTFYACCFCMERVKWGEIVRVLLHHPGTTVSPAATEAQEVYAHAGCLRSRCCPEVVLGYNRRGGPAQATAPLSHGCCFCPGEATADAIWLRLQRPVGTVRRPEFDEQDVIAHPACVRQAMHREVLLPYVPRSPRVGGRGQLTDAAPGTLVEPKT
jgi:hypothetical protein